MGLSDLLHQKKHRRYPITRDRDGKSLRSRCFVLFDQEKRPVEVAEELEMKVPTVCRYFRDWKRLGPNFERQHAYFKELLKKTSPDRERTIELCALACRITKEQFEDILRQPHGLRRIMTGNFYFPAQVEADRKRYVALELAFTISNHLVNNGGKFEDVNYAFQRWMKENQVYRKEEDEFIQEENKDIQFMRRIIEVDLENERQGRTQPERLSSEEKDTILKWGQQSTVRQMERIYWIRISLIMAEGMTVEKAREKIYQDLRNNRDIEGAKALRAYQNIIHPLKIGDQ